MAVYNKVMIYKQRSLYIHSYPVMSDFDDMFDIIGELTICVDKLLQIIYLLVLNGWKSINDTYKIT